MKLYTRTGDDGSTGLPGGRRVPKDDRGVEACGAIDELNAALGLVVASDQRDEARLRDLQGGLFELGADLAEAAAGPGGTRRITEARVAGVEAWIDEVESANPPLETFILPGGCQRAARLHLARTICRRAERAMVTLARESDLETAALRFVNRVGDLLFALARQANREAGVDDIPWVR